MKLFNAIWETIRGFFSFDRLIGIIREGNYEIFLTWEGFTAAIGPIIPLLLTLELLRGLLYKKFSIVSYKIPFLSFVLNSVLGRFISIGMVTLSIGLFEKYAPWKLPMNVIGFLAGYVVWEFGHFIYHYLGHKVRLFWCLHSTHHAPEDMNLAVSWSHFFLEAPYADIIRTTICILAGVPPVMLGIIMFIDGTWGAFIHIGESMLKDGNLGKVGKFLLTPTHHRIHHARNPQYMDTNFCNLLNIWDRVFKTYQPEIKDLPIEYGITRPMKKNGFLDAYFGEFVALAQDVIHAPGWKNKLLYIVMPPGWSHTGDHKTAHVMKQKLAETISAQTPATLS